MALLPLLPGKLDLTATSEAQVTSTRRRAIVQGALAYDELQVFDEDAQPFPIGVLGAPLWSLRGQLRRGFSDAVLSIEATFTCDWLFEGDGSSLGRWFYKLTAIQTAAVRAQRGTVDFEMVNLSDPQAVVGDVFKLHRGVWVKVQETTA